MRHSIGSSISGSRTTRLALDFRQLNLQLVVKESALGTVLRARSSDIGASSVDAVSSTLDYNLGVYDNRPRQRRQYLQLFIAQQRYRIA